MGFAWSKMCRIVLMQILWKEVLYKSWVQKWSSSLNCTSRCISFLPCAAVWKICVWVQTAESCFQNSRTNLENSPSALIIWSPLFMPQTRFIQTLIKLLYNFYWSQWGKLVVTILCMCTFSGTICLLHSMFQ